VRCAPQHASFPPDPGPGAPAPGTPRSPVVRAPHEPEDTGIRTEIPEAALVRWGTVSADSLLSASELAPAGRGGPRSERFLAACARRPVDATPVWMMRQAGRSLPAYRELRQRFGLVEITRQPDLCAEVTLMPIRVLDVDAAIMFADIMLPLAGLGVRFELVEDLVTEAAVRARQAKERTLSDAVLLATVAARRRRNTRIEDRVIRSIVEGAVMIDTTGQAVGQVNALTITDIGDRRFGTPVRVTARASVGRVGIINIERDVELGGPIQQKGAMVLQGFLAGRFGQILPPSFTCSITFEQSYGGVEGDSASLAELIAVLSDLAQLPIRQDVAITGSVNQVGRAQAIGGARWKIEGFFRVCEATAGSMTGSQGVIVPAANRVNLVLRDDVAEAVASGRFHLWSVVTVEDALELLLGTPAGIANGEGLYPPDSVFGRVAARLAGFDLILAARQAANLPGSW